MKRLSLILIVVASGCFNGNHHTLHVAGVLEGIDVNAGSLVGGRIAKVHVKEGDRVAAGDLLVELDDNPSGLRTVAFASHPLDDALRDDLDALQAPAAREDAPSPKPGLVQYACALPLPSAANVGNMPAASVPVGSTGRLHELLDPSRVAVSSGS